MATETNIPPLTVSNPWWGHDPSDKQLEALWAMRSVLISFTVGLLARARRVTCSWLLSSTSTILTTGP